MNNDNTRVPDSLLNTGTLRELELFGFPRMLDPIYHASPNGMVEMESVKVLDLLHVLMDTMWRLIQSMRRDRNIEWDEHEDFIKAKSDLKILQTDFQKLQAELKQKNQDLGKLSNEAARLKHSVAELTAENKSQSATIRQLKSQMRKLEKASTTKESITEIEVSQLKEQLRQSLGLGISHGSRRPTDSERLQEFLEQEMLLKEVIVKHQETIDVLSERKIADSNHRIGEKSFKAESGEEFEDEEEQELDSR